MHEDIESALADCRLGKKMRPQTLKWVWDCGGAGSGHPQGGAAAEQPRPHCRGHQEKLRQRQSVLPPRQGPAPVPVHHHAQDASPPKNRVSQPGEPRALGWGLMPPLGAQSAAALPPPVPHPGFYRQESQDEEPPRAVLAQKIEKETVGLSLIAPPTGCTRPSPGPGAKGHHVGLLGAQLTPAPALTPANPQLCPG